MTHQCTHSTGAGPAFISRRGLVLAAGLLALCLQVMAQTLTPAAMQNVMRVAALTSDDAQSFAGTCLGFSQRNDGQPVKPGNHASCPVCFTLAQTQGFAPAPADFAITIAWTSLRQIRVPAAPPGQSLAAASFASRAPPDLIG